MSLDKMLGKNLIEGSLLCYVVQKTRQMIAIVPPEIKIFSLSVWKNLHFQALRTLAQCEMGFKRSEKQAEL